MSSDGEKSNITNFPGVNARHSGGGDKGGGPSNTGNGNGTGGGDLEKRVEKLEQTVYDIQIRLVKIDSRLDNVEKQMATKTDLQELSVSLHKSLNEQTWKFIAAAGALAGLAFTAAKFIHGS